MVADFYMPTRVVAGQGSLGTIGTLARELKMFRVLVVANPVISAQPFHAAALAALAAAGFAVARFDEAGIDARCSHIDSEGDRVRREGIDGVVCVGGGSVMCTGRGIAIVATNRKLMVECTGVGTFDRKALPMELQLDLTHPNGVGVLLPYVIAFNLAVLPDKIAPMADALQVK